MPNMSLIRHICNFELRLSLIETGMRGVKIWYENIEQCEILTPLIPVSDVDQTQTQLKIANGSDQTHNRHINWGILPVWYDKATAGSWEHQTISNFEVVVSLGRYA